MWQRDKDISITLMGLKFSALLPAVAICELMDYNSGKKLGDSHSTRVVKLHKLYRFDSFLFLCKYRMHTGPEALFPPKFMGKGTLGRDY